MATSEEFIGTTGYLTSYAWCRLNRCRYNRVRLYFLPGATAKKRDKLRT